MAGNDPLSFAVDLRLQGETFILRDLPLCRVLLMDNACYPWLILVPRLPGLIEIGDLPPVERALLWEEVCEVSDALKRMSGAAKMNVATLGNIVPQLHVHIVARNVGDAAWPSPVWGGPKTPYADEARDTMLTNLRSVL